MLASIKSENTALLAITIWFYEVLENIWVSNILHSHVGQTNANI